MKTKSSNTQVINPFYKLRFLFIKYKYLEFWDPTS
jgi:hypothetical protein